MIRFLSHLLDVFQGKAKLGCRRSSQWAKVRQAYLKDHPTCAVCGGKQAISVHHLIPYSLRPDLELDCDNFLTLCEDGEGGINHHILMGHLGSYLSYNKDAVEDAYTWAEKIKGRP